MVNGQGKKGYQKCVSWEYILCVLLLLISTSVLSSISLGSAPSRQVSDILNFILLYSVQCLVVFLNLYLRMENFSSYDLFNLYYQLFFLILFNSVSTYFFAKNAMNHKKMLLLDLQLSILINMVLVSLSFCFVLHFFSLRFFFQAHKL